MSAIILPTGQGGELITTALNRIARQCSVSIPSSWITATRADQVEIRDDFLVETIDDLMDRVDLPGPIGKQYTVAGDGSESYSLPEDFKRLQRDELAVYDEALDRPCVPVTEDGMYTHIKDLGTAGVIRYFRLRGWPSNYTIDFYNEPTSNIIVSYISSNWLATSSGTAVNEFTAETDVLLLPRRVVETGAVWRFRERRGLPYMDKYNEHEALVARLSNDRRARRKINFGQADQDVRWQDMIPSFIPSS